MLLEVRGSICLLGLSKAKAKQRKVVPYQSSTNNDQAKVNPRSHFFYLHHKPNRKLLIEPLLPFKHWKSTPEDENNLCSWTSRLIKIDWAVQEIWPWTIFQPHRINFLSPTASLSWGQNTPLMTVEGAAGEAVGGGKNHNMGKVLPFGQETVHLWLKVASKTLVFPYEK